jgi:hypothetical protein
MDPTKDFGQVPGAYKPGLNSAPGFTKTTTPGQLGASYSGPSGTMTYEGPGSGKASVLGLDRATMTTANANMRRGGGGGSFSVVGGAPAGVDEAAYAAMSPAQKSAAKIKSMEEATAAIRDMKDTQYSRKWLALPEGQRGRMPDRVADTLGENRREWGSNRQIPRPPPSELNQDLYKETYKARLGMASEEQKAQLAGASQQSLEQMRQAGARQEKLMKAAEQIFPERTDGSGNPDNTARVAGLNLAETMKGAFGGDAGAALPFVAQFVNQIPTMEQIAAMPDVVKLQEPARTQMIQDRYQALLAEAQTRAYNALGRQQGLPPAPPAAK